MGKIIEIKDMEVSYSNKNVLSNISVTIESGSYVVICGKSGVGKSTFLKALVGLVSTKGKIMIDGLSVQDKNLNKSRSITSVIFENPNTNLICETVEDELKSTLKNRGYKKKTCDEKVTDLVKKLKIEHLLSKLVVHLSGGEKQLVAFASAIITEPKILILDEAFTMLDKNAKSQIMKYLKEYHKETNCTILQATNDMEDTLEATHIMILKDGTISNIDTKEELLKNEKAFKEAGLTLPFTAELSLKLKYYGLMDEPILDIDKMVKHLWK